MLGGKYVFSFLSEIWNFSIVEATSVMVDQWRMVHNERSINYKIKSYILFFFFFKVWERIAPGLASKFDAPYTVPAIAPRPLLILNGASHI